MPEPLTWPGPCEMCDEEPCACRFIEDPWERMCDGCDSLENCICAMCDGNPCLCGMCPHPDDDAEEPPEGAWRGWFRRRRGPR